MKNQTKVVAETFNPVKKSQKVAYAWCLDGVTYQWQRSDGKAVRGNLAYSILSSIVN